ncbi:uncharacterized protein LOC106075274 [Biomphalaria glabrata]|uniref:Uncharacterized protein LOC106075274 n=1 Tax=Biomphalaria glabrata TaxID=6526 RepID=A0A9W3A8X0_BIOGL|nr:uncharacterized protein LOC106075274 [Biomphalaria glabrata]
MDYLVSFRCIAILLTAVLFGLAARTSQECQKDFLDCQTNYSVAPFLQNVTEHITELCLTGRTYLKCVEHIECKDDMYLLLAYNIIQRNMSASNSHCELGNPPNGRTYSSEDCNSKVKTCRQSYVDNIVVADTMNKDRNETVICQHLNTFRNCLLQISSCGSEREEVDKMTRDEKSRMNLENCESLALKTATANYLLVAIATILVSKLH